MGLFLDACWLSCPFLLTALSTESTGIMRLLQVSLHSPLWPPPRMSLAVSPQAEICCKSKGHPAFCGQHFRLGCQQQTHQLSALKFTQFSWSLEIPVALTFKGQLASSWLPSSYRKTSFPLIMSSEVNTSYPDPQHPCTESQHSLGNCWPHSVDLVKDHPLFEFFPLSSLLFVIAF